MDGGWYVRTPLVNMSYVGVHVEPDARAKVVLPLVKGRNIHRPALSPDGRWLAYQVNRGGHEVWRLEGL